MYRISLSVMHLFPFIESTTKESSSKTLLEHKLILKFVLASTILKEILKKNFLWCVIFIHTPPLHNNTTTSSKSNLSSSQKPHSPYHTTHNHQPYHVIILLVLLIIMIIHIVAVPSVKIFALFTNKNANICTFPFD